MEALYLRSRSIINNHVYERLQNSRLDNHQKAINRIRTKPSINHFNTESPKYLRNLERYKSAHQSVKKIFSSSLNQNQSLYRRLTDIQQKKVKSIFNQTSNIEKSNKKYHREQQRKRIQYQNNKIKQKIEQQRKNKLTVQKLRKQFKQHDKLVNHAMKLR